MAFFQFLRPRIGLLQYNYTRLSLNDVRYGLFKRHYYHHHLVYGHRVKRIRKRLRLWDPRLWNMTSEICLFWRTNPSSTETYLVLGWWALYVAVVPFLAVQYCDWVPQVPKHLEDLEEVADDGVAVGFALPGAAKSVGSHYSRLLYKDDIRLLILHPGDTEDEIQCHMEHVRLGTPHSKYEALSYAWGNRIATKSIRCSDKEIPITGNLHAALHSLRYKDRSRKLWADALCIDQSDIDERNQQIRLMGDVFSEADRVIVWLGKEKADTASALESIQALHNDFHSQRPSVMSKYILWSKTSTDNVLRRSIADSNFGEVSKHNFSDIDWSAIGNLMRRTWFHRLWVVQEVAHARRAVVLCGDLSISWTVLSEALTYVVEDDLNSKYLDKHCSHACKNVVNIEKTRQQKTRDSLFEVVLANAYGGCADPRDKIFAMMSISEGRDAFDWEISFDYSLSVTELFKHFAIWDVIRYQSLRSLSCATTGPKDFRVSPPLPSWVPDWTRLLEQNLLVRCSATSGFSASRGVEIDFWFMHEKSRMHVQGIVIDHIHTLGSVPYFTKTTSIFEINDEVINELGMINSWLCECWDIASNGKRMTRTTYEAFWRTMLCGVTGNGYPTSQKYSEYFLQYMKYLREAPEMLDYYLYHPNPVSVCRLSVADSIVEKVASYLGSSISSSRASYSDAFSWKLHRWFNEHFSTNSLIEESIQTWGTYKRFCRTQEGRLARVPENAAIGDSICIFHGAEVPYVLRLQEDGTYTVVGECYVHGVMHGEAIRDRQYQEETLRIR